VKITRGVTASVVIAGLAAVGFASPAWADDFSGTYNIDYGGKTATWTVTPCDVEPPFTPCVHVAEGGSPVAPWQSDAFWSVGSWSLFAERPDVLVCSDGTNHPARATYALDAVTLSGFISIFDNKVCGEKARTLYAPIKLTKTG
jgi:hypothetical protein